MIWWMSVGMGLCEDLWWAVKSEKSKNINRLSEMNMNKSKIMIYDKNGYKNVSVVSRSGHLERVEKNK